MVVLIASIGFTSDFVLRRVTGERVRRVVAVGLRTGDEVAWRRVENSFKMLAALLDKMGVGSELREVSVGSGRGIIRDLADIIVSECYRAGCREDIELYLTGGPRLLVVSFVVASMLVPFRVLERLIIRVSGEAFEDEISIRPLQVILVGQLDETDRSILKAIIENGGEAPVKEILSTVSKARSLIYKKLGKLEEKGLVQHIGRGVWKVAEGVDKLVV